jgi:hypothetical protein
MSIQVKPANFINLNCNSDRRRTSPLYGRYLEKYGHQTRILAIVEFTKEYLLKNYIVALFELDTPTCNAIKELIPHKFISFGYNTDPTALNYLIYIPEIYTVEDVKHVAYTSTYEFVDNDSRPKTDSDKRSDLKYMEMTGGELFEKSFICLKISLDSQSYNLIITHQGLGMEQRLFQTHRLMDWIKSNLDDDIITIIGGDLNSFDVKNDDIILT